MASGLEVRVPFLDDNVVRFANSLPLTFKVSGRLRISKYILKRLFLNTAGECSYDSVLRSKEGFPSSGSKLLAEFIHLCETNVADDYVIRHPYYEYLKESSRLALGPPKCAIVLFDLFHYSFVERGGVFDHGLDIWEFISDRSHKRAGLRVGTDRGRRT